ncbi:hypothetical protein DV737_g1461, partial [Chaetothyriales sp. CBS 132003]
MDFYDDPSGRSPRLLRNPTMNNRPPGRPDAFGGMQGMYGGDNGMAPAAARFNSMRDPFAAPSNMNAVNMNAVSMNFPYDAAAASTCVKHSRGRVGLQNVRGPALGPDDDDELIPTAIVIKNIPFAVKKEQLVQLMVDMNLPLPYAFNYHFDNGVFRGLAFANFTSPNETDAVIQALNQMELSGRKLRVEYKKMLPLAERERIEREKRERRGQLEEQHRPVVQSQLHNQLSLSSMSRNTPSPLSQRAGGAKPEVDMNDPETLKFYTEMTLFRSDPSREVLIFSPTLTPEYRRVVHTLAHQLGLQHTSRGTGDQRQVHVTRAAPGTNVSPPSINLTLRGQSSVGMLDVEGYTRNNDTVIRNAKSFADLRTWSPSPAASPRRQRSLFGSAWDDSQAYAAAGPIGSKRAVSTMAADSAADRNPLRQPRGTTPNTAIGFRHPAAHGSDELRATTTTTAIAE